MLVACQLPTSTGIDLVKVSSEIDKNYLQVHLLHNEERLLGTAARYVPASLVLVKNNSPSGPAVTYWRAAVTDSLRSCSCSPGPGYRDNSPSDKAVRYWRTAATDSCRICSHWTGLIYKLFTFWRSCHILKNSCQRQLEDLLLLAWPEIYE